MMKQRFKIVPAVYIILRDGDKILLLKRANTGYHDGLYALPAGHIDGDEPALQAAIREAKEEVGITIPEASMRFVHVMHRVAEEGDHERVDFFFEADDWQGEPRNMEPEKCDDVQWFSLDALPANMSDISKIAVEKVAASEVYSDHNF